MEEKVQIVEQKLFRASKLLKGLQNEKTIWVQKRKAYEEDSKQITGDSLLCSAQIAYFGPFDVNIRKEV